MKRPTISEAKRMYVHRYTMEHIPQWARKIAINGKWYAPQFRSDKEWYDNTVFFKDGDYCHTSGQTWPMGEWLLDPPQVAIRVTA